MPPSPPSTPPKPAQLPLARAARPNAEPSFILDGAELDDDLESPTSVPLTSEALRERACAQAARVRVRPKWESTLFAPNDPILAEKRKPYVAERRARLARVVKVTLAACGVLCVLALFVAALGGEASANAAGASPESNAANAVRRVPQEGQPRTLETARRVKVKAKGARFVQAQRKHAKRH